VNTYTNNTLIVLTGAIAVTSTGAPINATSIICRVTTPDGVVTDYSGSVVNPTTGTYVYNFLAVQVGLHQYEFVASGTAVVGGINQFIVNQSTF
jgi:hypothetical protein